MTKIPAQRFAHVRIASGLKLHVVEHGLPEGEPIVFVHGWPDSWFSYSRVLELLPPSLRAITFDQRGFGDSDKPETGYAMAGMADDVVALLDALGIGRAAVVGHSFGSIIARQAAIAHPERVSSLVLIGTGFPPSNPVLRDLQGSLRDLPDPIPVVFARDFQASTIHHPVPPEFFDRIVEESLKLPPRLWRLLIDRLLEHDDTRQLERITAPTLLLWGDQDALFSKAEQERFMTALPAATLKVYEGTGHCPNWERPELVAADILAHVRG
jgi:pimeloyl-ACP methyl ester carboxylesterase